MQRLSDGAVVPVFGVGDDRGQRHAGRPRAAHQRQGQAPFLLKARPSPGSAPPRAARGSRRPRLGQIQQGAHGPRALARPERGGHRDLAIGHLAQRAAVLPRHADRMRPRFREARFVEDQNARALRRSPRRSRRHTTSASHGACVMKCWNAWYERRLADPLEHRRHRLARAVAQQPVDILAQRHVLRAMAEAVLELIQPARQPSRPSRPIAPAPPTAARARARS